MESIDEYDDISTINSYNEGIKSGMSEKEALYMCYRISRDNARTPMQWNSSKNAGFTDGKPWLKVNQNYTDINVENQLENENSVLRYYQKLIALRKSEEYSDIFTNGHFEPAYLEEHKVFAYYRKLDNKKILVVANFGEAEVSLNLEERGEVILSNMDKVGEVENKLVVKSCEVYVIHF